MNRPEGVDHVAFLERCLGCSTALAIEVLGRASLDPLWEEWSGEPGRLEDLAWKALGEVRRRRLAAATGDPGPGRDGGDEPAAADVLVKCNTCGFLRYASERTRCPFGHVTGWSQAAREGGDR